ncbi:MAG: helix-turn-helix transcriptional regulator [Actinobacteria bacterium]|nr:helix-turn-helix transcriptional regulator [Actinomycetota bacterium]
MDSPPLKIWNATHNRTRLRRVPPTKPRTREREALGRAIRVLRAERAVSQEEVEAAGGLGQNAIGRIERGASAPSFDSLVGVAEGLGVPLSVLIEVYERQLARAPR